MEAIILHAKPLLKGDIHLDMIRGLAALAVALGHARGLFFESVTNAAPVAGAAIAKSGGAVADAKLTLGHAAVMVFFVLSGYLVGGSVLKSISSDRWSWSNYLVKRLVRLWIVLVPAILIGIALDRLGVYLFGGAGSLYSSPPGQDYVRPGSLQSDGNPLIILGNISFLQTFIVPVIGTNVPLWSLANEFWYYILFPLMILLFSNNSSVLLRVLYALVAFSIVMLIGKDASVLFLTWVIGAITSVFPKMKYEKFAKFIFIPYSMIFIVFIIQLKKQNLPLTVCEFAISIGSAILIYLAICQKSVSRRSVYERIANIYRIFRTPCTSLTCRC